ncbi:DUF883 family protein [Sphingobium sp. Cam5-1]|uniref:DUF883 family protein n=1 Tax=Sphingobium sp. Cam5-1 TaxID=2789327 RepID=UPI0018AD2480|nr:DUF883 family protein [Sphingobium sp. Cam5-1]QPI74031.1 DUF883 family protein [Sphingobium sp. Cam5-1]
MADIHAQITRVRDAANDIAGTATGKFRDSTEKARENAAELIQTGRERAGGAYSDVRDRTQRVAARANEIVQEHPVAAVAGAVAAGAVVAWLFPKSRRAIKALPAIAMTAGSRVVEAAMAASAAAAQGAENIKTGATDALHNAQDSAAKTAASARDAAASADITGTASRMADDLVSLVTGKIDAVSDALKARLPKR